MTICAWGRNCVFGEILDAEMELNGFGRIVRECWDDFEYHYGHLILGTFVIMPNHIHGIMILTPDSTNGVGAGLKPAPTNVDGNKRHRLPEIVRGFKTFSARRINQLRATPGTPVWQRNYFEHVIRDERSLNRIRQYIFDNPAKWNDAPENLTRSVDNGRGGFKTRPYTPI